MTSTRIELTLPHPWDRVAVAVERAIDPRRTSFELIDRGNGYWHLHAGNVTVHVELRIVTPASTHIWIVGKRRRRFAGGDVEAILDTLRGDIALELPDTSPDG
jgi:hypothetical protein